MSHGHTITKTDFSQPQREIRGERSESIRAENAHAEDVEHTGRDVGSHVGSAAGSRWGAVAVVNAWTHEGQLGELRLPEHPTDGRGTDRNEGAG